MIEISLYTLYTDGSCQSDTRKGGAAFLLVNQDSQIIHKSSQYLTKTTSNAAELYAIHAGLEYAKIQNLKNILIITDSRYCKVVLTNSQIYESNYNLIMAIRDFIQEIPIVTIEWKRRCSDKFMIEADRMAGDASYFGSKIVDVE